jgi:hypothetical protein
MGGQFAPVQGAIASQVQFAGNTNWFHGRALSSRTSLTLNLMLLTH